MIAENKAKKYCCEDISRIENYDKAMTDMEQIWECHHRLEVGANGELIARGDLINHGLYYDRPADELIFLTKEQHTTLHNNNRRDDVQSKMSKSLSGRKLTDDVKLKISQALKGNKNCVGRKLSQETKNKIGKASKGRVSSNKGKHLSEETKRKVSEAKKGVQTWLGKHHSEETKQKIREARKAYWEKKREELKHQA